MPDRQDGHFKIRQTRRVAVRAAQDPVRHDLTNSKIRDVVERGDLNRDVKGKNGYVQYELKGKQGTYEVGGRWVNGNFYVTHAFVRP